MAERKRGGFHSLEKKIHDLEDQDRTVERKAGEERAVKRDQPPREPERRPPPAHDE